MKPIFAVFFLLEVIITTAQTFNGAGWRKNVKGFLNEKSNEEITGLHVNDRMCAEMKKHVLLFEEKEILSKFDACDLSDSGKQCYFYAEKVFHITVDNSVRIINECNEKDVCSIWNMEILLSRLSRNCFYFESVDDVFKIWSKCSFIQPLDELAEFHNNLLRRGRNICNRKPLDNMSNAIEIAYKSLDTCKKINPINTTKNGDCWNKVILRKKYLAIRNCFDKHLKALQQNLGNAFQVARACANGEYLALAIQKVL